MNGRWWSDLRLEEHRLAVYATTSMPAPSLASVRSTAWLELALMA